MLLSTHLPKILLLATAMIITLTSPAFADAKDARIDAMEKQMLIMMAEIKALKAERAAEKAEQTALKQQIQTLETKTTEQIAAIAPAAGNNSATTGSDVKVTMKGSAPKFTKGDFSWQPTGRIHLDAGIINDDKRDHPNSAEFRRARLGMKGTVAKNFGYKAELDFANEGVAFTDVYMNYTGVKNTEFRLGHFSPGYSLEDTTSSNDITFIERASVVNAFDGSQQIGAGALHHGKNYHVALGAFNDDAGTQSTDDEQWSVSGRAVATPIKEDNKTLHLGVSASYREPDQANDTFDFDARAENRLQTTDSVSSVITDGENATIYGLEAAAAIGPFSAQGEYIIADIENRGGQNPTYQGAYGQIAWTVTGESRPYKIKNGAFGSIKPERPLDPSKGDWGALELAARYSHLDLNDGGLNGGEMNSITLGANWYLNDYMRLMANYIMVDTDNNATTPNDNPEIILLRSQVKF